MENKGYQLFERGSVEKLFKRYDTDGSGQLDYGEFSRALGDVGVHLEPREFARVIHHVDANRDGQVDFKEFVDMIKDERGEMMRAPHMATHLKGGGILPLKGIESRGKGKKMYYDPHISNPVGGPRRNSLLDHKIVNVNTGQRRELTEDEKYRQAVCMKKIANVMGASKDKINQAFRKFDINNDGVVTAQEFKDAIRYRVHGVLKEPELKW